MGKDALTLLKEDHQKVRKMLKRLHSNGTEDLLNQVETELKIHTQIEEEIFYPAFLADTKDKDTHHEALVEHAGAKKLIAEIQGASSGDDFFDAKVTVLSEMIKHHVKEEEQPGGMFAEAKKSDMDLGALGDRLQARKKELQAKLQAA